MRKTFLPIYFIIICVLATSLWFYFQNTNIQEKEAMSDLSSALNIEGTIRIMSPSEIKEDTSDKDINVLQKSNPQENITLPLEPNIAKDIKKSSPSQNIISNNSATETPPQNPDRQVIVNPPQISKPQIPSLPRITERLMPLTHSASRSATQDVTHIVIHFASNVIARPDNPHIPEDVINIFQKYNVSAHYLIARDGVIFRLVDENRVAFHAGRGSLVDFPQYTNNLNRHSIGIELLAMGTEEEMSRYISRTVYRSIPAIHIGFTDAQYESLNYLLPQIYVRHGIQPTRRYVIGHDEYAGSRKIDPGSLFDWSRIGF